ncbi:helix-turn-helix transcriptional regulator [Pseudomonas sp. BP8]|uniref:helix-turn-helix transcriptional regulator n=1 Tax=Pseudomonas sp. BP8 TaxID=2817864 RepID=UPI001AE26665|nr:helix-turn-helix transcriptional regulator [Pseudomonas sp. BP8]MBP2261996.1 DNA-binding CsgD family transcriptional regulator [Pseudomonas sp. BP8]HDS1735419.1 PAS domain-containing protein [Pseudomonas putida]
MFEQDRLNPDSLFSHLPVAVIIARHRVILNCNIRALKMFRADEAQIIGASFAVLYPEQKDFETAAEHFGPLLSRHADFEDDRLMRRLDGTHFWVTVRGYGFIEDNPYELAAWVFTEAANKEQAVFRDRVSLTARERDVAALLVDGLTSKEAARNLGISPRTVDIHRASLLRKYSVSSTQELIRRIVN